MKRKQQAVRILLTLSIVLLAAASFADGDDANRRRRRGSENGPFQGDRAFAPVNNPLYAEQCGECHFAYPPGLLPAGSWRKILSDLGNHNGMEVIIEPAATQTIQQYLETNSAENSPSRAATRIIRSLGGNTPTRITHVPYISHKHHDIPPDVFKRESIGSFSNCVACHRTAEQGVFKDDFVIIPD